MQAFSFLRKNLFLSFCTIACLSLAGTLAAQTNDAIQLNGSNAYAEVLDNNALDLSNNLTLEAWIYPTGPGGDATQGGMIINKENSYEIARWGDGTIQYAFSANGTGSDWVGWINTGLVAPQDQWTHVAMVKSGTAITIYINGVASFTANNAPATLTANTYNLRIGHRSVGASPYFQGYLDEIRLWNTARTSAEIKNNLFNSRLSNNATGLVAYYRMNEGSGSTLSNSCTNTSGIDGTLSGGYSWVASPVQFAGNALNFNGISNYIELTNRITLGTADFTIEAWVYPQSTTTGMVFAQDVCGDGEYQFRLYTSNSKVNFDFSDATTFGAAYSFQLPSTANSVPLNTWTHVAATRSGNDYTVYINGVANATYSTGSNTINNQSGADANKRLRIGARGGVSSGCGLNYFNGSIDEVRFWNVARTATEIQQNYLKEINPASNSNLVAYYSFDQGIAAGSNTGLTTLIDQKGDNNGVLHGFALTGSSSNFVAQNGTLVVLPVQLVSFTASRVSAGIQLNWQTASEQNSLDFTVERSADGHSWASLARLPAAGNSSTGQRYSYLDASPLAGNNFYRLLQSDIDGRTSYSPVVRVAAAGNTRSFSLQSANISNGLLQVMVYEPVMLRMFSMDGKLLWSRALSTGYKSIPLQVPSRGIYILKGGYTTEKLYAE
ncbi:MAG TPA: LamG domain-containing protein [Sediminibacterium sp.]|nr:LamG domain-containing protein [Sediminibacterium sp.]